ncbi:MAG: hypothetical protein V4706_02785 [Pseudomonadota bacterium]
MSAEQPGGVTAYVSPLELIAPHPCLQDAAFSIVFHGEGAHAFIVTGGWPAMLRRYRLETMGSETLTSALDIEIWQAELERFADLDENWTRDESQDPFCFHQQVGEITNVAVYRLTAEQQPVTVPSFHALAELVACKKLRDSLPRNDDFEDSAVIKKWAEYRNRKNRAWRRAEGVLKLETAVPRVLVWETLPAEPPPAMAASMTAWLSSTAEELHPLTKNLVVRFARALARKLLVAEKKYGHTDGWAKDDWLDECRRQLLDHVDKGDPVDVAAYCAFLWHHNSSTFSRPWNDMSTAPLDGSIIRLLVEFEDHQLEDHEAPQHTIGCNSFKNTGVDEWQFVGWCWTHDHFTDGVGKPVGWLPFSPCAL